MCLAKAYSVEGKELVMEDVSHLKIDGNRLLLKSLFGEEKAVEGFLKEVDFQNSRIVLEKFPEEKR